MTQPDPETFTSLIQWLRERGDSALALKLRRKGIGSLSALLGADAATLRDAGCPEAIIHGRGPNGHQPSAKLPQEAAEVLASCDIVEEGAWNNNEDQEIIEFFEGARVRVFGLKSTPELNGKLGILVGYDEKRQRWILELGEGLGRKLFREANLAPHGTRKGNIIEGKAAPPAVIELAAPPRQPNPPSAPKEAASADAQVQMEGAEAAQRQAFSWAKGQRQAAEAERSSVEPRPSALAPTEPPREPAASVPRPLRPGAQVVVHGDDALAHLASQVGVCEANDFGTGLWRVRFEDGTFEEVRPGCLSERPPMLRAGAYVAVRGLASAPQLNGVLGICDTLDAESARWSVCLETGERRFLKAENLRPEDGSARRAREAESDRAGHDQLFLSVMEDALASGEISWLDC